MEIRVYTPISARPGDARYTSTVHLFPLSSAQVLIIIFGGRARHGATTSRSLIPAPTEGGDESDLSDAPRADVAARPAREEADNGYGLDLTRR